MAEPHRIDASDDPGRYLNSTRYLDSGHPAVQAYAREKAGAGSDTEKAIRLYYGVRDDFLYDPYGISLDTDFYRASRVLEDGKGFCIQKAGLLAASARAVGIPARVAYADVRNHLATPRLLELLESDLFIWHGITELYLDGRWVKATPAFNLSLCERFRVKALDFDGRADSMLQPFDEDGRRHMEYLQDRGSFADIPVDTIIAEFAAMYPKYFALHGGRGADFAAEAASGHAG